MRTFINLDRPSTIAKTLSSVRPQSKNEVEDFIATWSSWQFPDPDANPISKNESKVEKPINNRSDE